MIDVETEVNKHKNIKDRDKLERVIKEYKSLALNYASDFKVAGKYNTVATKLQAYFDRLPAPRIINPGRGSKSGASVKTATITREENEQIKAAWKQKADKSSK